MQRQQTGGRTKAYLLLSLSMIAAVVAVVLVMGIVKRAQQEVADARLPEDTIQVVVAVRELNVGVVIGPDDVTARDMLPSMVPELGTFARVDDVVGRTPRERVLANELIRDDRLALKDAGIGLNAIIEPGRRAMAVEVNSQSGVAGFIRPGNFVDVIVTIKPDDRGAKAKWMSHAFLQGVRVLAVGRNMGEDAEGKVPQARPVTVREKPTVTLELDLEQAEALALAASKGDIHIVLRNDVDITAVDTQGTFANAIIGLDSLPAESNRRVARRRSPDNKPEPGSISEVIHGANVEEVRFESDGRKAPGSTSGR